MEVIKKSKPSSAHSNKSDGAKPFLGIQAKLNVNKPGDKYEVEADQAAEQVVSKQSTSTPAFVPSTSPVQLKQQDEQPVVQEKPLAAGITPFVQAKEEEPAQAKEEEVLAKEEEPAQMMEEEPAQAQEEEVQAKEEEVQAKEEEPAQMVEEEPAQAKEEEVQAKEDEPAQMMEDEPAQAKEEEVQAKEEEPAQMMEEEPAQAQEEEVQSKEEETQAKEDEELQTKLQPSAPPNSSGPSINDKLRSSKGAGSPLSGGVKQEMESGFGADFSNVKIHTDDRAASMSKEIGAQAFTNKGDVYFNQGKFNPASEQGKTLLAHELTHTIQQGAAAPKQEDAKGKDEKAPADGKTIAPETAPQTAGDEKKEETPAETATAAGASSSAASSSGSVNVTAEEPAKIAPIEGTPLTADALKAEGEAEGETGKEEEVAEEPSIVRDPKQNPNFQAVVAGIDTAADSQTEHDPAEELSGDAQEAAVSPDNEQSSMAQANQVDEMEAQEPQEFSAANFKAMLMKRIEEMQLPENNDEADKFEENNNIDEVNQQAVGDVNKEKDAAAGPIEQTTGKEPDTSAVPKREAKELVPPEAGPVPGSVGATKAIPETRPESEVSKPLEEDASELDTKMAENNVTDHQLEISQEPKFEQGLASKNDAKTNAATAPTGLRAKEQAVLQKNAAASETASQDQLAGMNELRGGAMQKVLGNQTTTGGKDTSERERIAGEINKIYDTTKTDVTGILDGLEVKVTEMFEYGSAKAKEKFEQHVEFKMWMYKAERYSGITGAAAWLYDLFAGLPDEVNEFFKEGRDIFVKVMDEHITKIAEYVAQELTRAKQRIEQGKQEVTDYVQSLPKNLQKFGKEAAEEINEKFEELQSDVNNKQEELVDTLAQEYVAALEEVDERIEEMKAANRGLIDMAMDFINGIIDTINKLIDLINSLLSAIASVINVIMADPIGFMENLFDGIAQGIDLFKANIQKHLLGGLLEWLTGSLGPMGITIPDDIFSLSGIFNLVLQVLGIGWDMLRMKSVKMMGEPAVNALETGADAGFTVFQSVKTQGIMGLWDFLKEKFTDLKEMVIDAIKDMLITQVIEAGIKWLLSLLIPGAGFIKAIMAIKDVIVFFVESAIMLIPALIEAILALAAGSVAGVAKAIEFGLAKLIPLVIGLLANLIGLGGLSKKVMKIFKKIRKRVDKAVNKLLAKAKKAARKILRKLGIGKKGEKKKKETDADIKDSGGIAAESFKMAGASHTLSFKKGKVRMASNNPGELGKKLASAKKEAEANPDAENFKGKGEHVIKSLGGLQNALSSRESNLATASSSNDDKKIKKAQKSFKELASNIGDFGTKYGLTDLADIAHEEAGGIKIALYKITPPFTIYPGNPADFKKQIKRQEAGINEMKVEEWIKNRDTFVQNGRGKDDLKDLRERIRRDIAQAYIRKNLNRLSVNFTRQKLELEAETHAKTILTRNHAILHNPDQVAGGKALVGQLYNNGDITDETSLKASGLVGDRGANSSMGSQWGANQHERVVGLYNHAKQELSTLDTNKKKMALMNVKLKYI